MFHSVQARATLPPLKRKWKGWKHIKPNITKTPNVKAATAFSNKNSNLMIKV